MKAGNLNFLESSGPLQACNGTDLPFCLFNPSFPWFIFSLIFWVSIRHCLYLPHCLQYNFLCRVIRHPRLKRDKLDTWLQIWQSTLNGRSHRSRELSVRFQCIHCFYCCIRCGPDEERILDIVPGGMELGTQVKTGSRAGRRHTQ